MQQHFLLNLYPKVKETKKKNKWYLIKLTSFYPAKEPTEKMKMQSAD